MRLWQVLFNLLSNACKFTKQGEVKLRARRVRNGRDWIEMAVADSGIGMTAESCSKNLPGRHDSAAFRRHRARPRHQYGTFAVARPKLIADED
jgi:signal transduction histidine kinase